MNIFRVISIEWNHLITLDRVTSTKWHSNGHQQSDIKRITSTEWHPQMYCLTVNPAPSRQSKIWFLPLHLLPMGAITGRTTTTAALSKTECSILHGAVGILGKGNQTSHWKCDGFRKKRAVLLKQQDGPTDTNSKNMSSNLDHQIVLHAV